MVRTKVAKKAFLEEDVLELCLKMDKIWTGETVQAPCKRNNRSKGIRRDLSIQLLFMGQ